MEGGYNCVNIEAAENGFVVKWYEKENAPQDGSFHVHIEEKRKQKVFTSKETDKAFDFFKKLKLQELGK